MQYDKIIIGAGLYGLYSALFCGRKGQHILVLECESAAFKRATFINQARVHQGYHYPRSMSTAKKSAHYFERFFSDYRFCIHNQFDKIYATSSEFSWSDGEQFKHFCDSTGIPCEPLNIERFFNEGMCDGAFLTREYTYDAIILRNYFLEKLSELSNVRILYNANITKIHKQRDFYEITLISGEIFQAGYVLNATYASTNQILDMLGYEKFQIKYELCEIILCSTNEILQNVGITVMDGPFFSIMPFGKTGLHSLTSVTFTPHATSYKDYPIFPCQQWSGRKCGAQHLANCNECQAKPATAFPYMEKLARKYLKEKYQFTYQSSLFSMKPILTSSEVDDSRPTVIKIYSQKPYFVGVLSGKINTVYDLDEVLEIDE